MNINAAANISGVTKILNPSKIQPDVDSKSTEDAFMKTFKDAETTSQIQDPEYAFNAAVKSILDGIDKSPTTGVAADPSPQEIPEEEIKPLNIDEELRKIYSNEPAYSRPVSGSPFEIPQAPERPVYNEISANSFLNDRELQPVDQPVDEILSEIDNYIQELNVHGVDHSNIKKPQEGMKYSDIVTIRNLLRHKSERILAGSLGETALISGAQLLGYVFDGERKFGPFRPSLAGWDATLRTKVERHRSSITTITKGVLDKVGLGSTAGFFLEIGMSALAYSNTQALRNRQNIDTEFSEANHILRD